MCRCIAPCGHLKRYTSPSSLWPSKPKPSAQRNTGVPPLEYLNHHMQPQQQGVARLIGGTTACADLILKRMSVLSLAMHGVHYHTMGLSCAFCAHSLEVCAAGQAVHYIRHLAHVSQLRLPPRSGVNLPVLHTWSRRRIARLW